MILALRTDKPEAELYLYTNEHTQLASQLWQAHRELSDTLLLKVDELLKAHELTLTDLTGLVVYQGPGSFTGLRIGITFMNTLAYTRKLPIVGIVGEDWLKKGLQELQRHPLTKIIVPEYGSEAHITKPIK